MNRMGFSFNITWTERAFFFEYNINGKSFFNITEQKKFFF